MTIGIAAHGPLAGRAILDGLALAERIGKGAVGGFVSLVVIGVDGRLHRAETQQGGTTSLFGGGTIPVVIAEAQFAALMSSGPDRPAPLSQFTPADAGIGLVTGHRLPNTVGSNGIALNVEVLALMRSGLGPAEAVEQVLAENPTVDGGIIAISVDGRIHAADTAYVAMFHDAGKAVLHSAFDPGITVAVLHNAIRPWRGLGLVVAETVLDVMDPPDAADREVHLVSGIPVVSGPGNSIHVDESGAAIRLTVSNRKFLTGEWHLGLGPHASIVVANRNVGVALYEPYLVLSDGYLRSVDGVDEFELPVRCRRQ
ncbi:hypothetical protein SAE02_70360 [Skermanella aerolata]|uniref:Uncharacterized protein n=1 Tax=Skermanella aerolata TaxID=393310 RepID=A0A512E2D0_9PROT|nr:hypothetical protein [Skermanella aerolata]KJB91399.1 hypothetical protein N826_30610 [Skermanella aerolata KACC 11604]GEO42888.1 hypothetical protein SAE02_70360 [Skermanella aerolata]